MEKVGTATETEEDDDEEEEEDEDEDEEEEEEDTGADDTSVILVELVEPVDPGKGLHVVSPLPISPVSPPSLPSHLPPSFMPPPLPRITAVSIR